MMDARRKMWNLVRIGDAGVSIGGSTTVEITAATKVAKTRSDFCNCSLRLRR